MAYTARNFSHLLGTAGFSDGLLKTHFALYEAYVTNTNKVTGLLEGLLKDDKASTPEYAEMKRRFGWEFNGMRLHEFYFENMSKEKTSLAEGSALRAKLAEAYGSVEAWEKDFRATGAMRGIGWAALYWDPVGGRVFNTWIHEHEGGHFANGSLLLVMDVWEHAFFVDYGAKRADYIAAFFGAIDWNVVEKRFAAAPKG